MDNPVMEAFELMALVKHFECAVKHNLVMSFSEYKERFSYSEDLETMNCEPFVYVDAASVDDEFGINMIVSAMVLNDNDTHIVSVYGQDSKYGFPRLSIVDDEENPSFVFMNLEYVNADVVLGMTECVDISSTACLNRITGRVFWNDTRERCFE